LYKYYKLTLNKPPDQLPPIIDARPQKGGSKIEVDPQNLVETVLSYIY
jgi:hypothetical protein